MIGLSLKTMVGFTLTTMVGLSLDIHDGVCSWTSMMELSLASMLGLSSAWSTWPPDVMTVSSMHVFCSNSGKVGGPPGEYQRFSLKEHQISHHG